MMTAKDNLLARHALGIELVKVIDSGRYGDDIVGTIAVRYKKSESWVRQHYGFAKQFPTLTVGDAEKIGSWTDARYLLPKRSKDPSSVGGEEKQVESVSKSVMRLVTEIRELASKPPEAEDLRKEMAQVLSVASTDLKESSLVFDAEVVDVPITNPITVEVDMFLKAEIEGWKGWVRQTQPCLICGHEPSPGYSNDFAHHPHTKAQLNEDWRGMSLCNISGNNCHVGKYHQYGVEWFNENYGDKFIAWIQEVAFRAMVALQRSGGTK
jgi:hypothetical protein